MKPEKNIRIIANGPYLVSQSIPLLKEQIAELRPVFVKSFKVEAHVLQGSYALCRCGNSENPPFCDQTHLAIDFKGIETASYAPYLERAFPFKSNGLVFLDDNRCSLARYCHRKNGDIWELAETSEDPESKKEVIEGASLCPTGRLTALNEEQEMIEIEYEPQIVVTDDPENEVSAGLHVRGYIPIVSANGFSYEVRNRVALCRCGSSCTKPFCDGTHISVGYIDQKVK